MSGSTMYHINSGYSSVQCVSCTTTISGPKEGLQTSLGGECTDFIHITKSQTAEKGRVQHHKTANMILWRLIAALAEPGRKQRSTTDAVEAHSCIDTDSGIPLVEQYCSFQQGLGRRTCEPEGVFVNCKWFCG